MLPQLFLFNILRKGRYVRSFWVSKVIPGVTRNSSDIGNIPQHSRTFSTYKGQQVSLASTGVGMNDDLLTNSIKERQKYAEVLQTIRDVPGSPSSKDLDKIIIKLLDNGVKLGSNELDLVRQLVTVLHTLKDDLTLQDLTQKLTSLTKIYEDATQFQSLINYIVERTNESEGEIDLGTLSQLTILTRTLPHFYTYPIIMPRLAKHLKRYILSDEDLLSLTIALKSFTKYLSSDSRSLYYSKVSHFAKSLKPSQDNNKMILKIVNLLNSSSWSMENSPLITSLMHHIDVSHLDQQDLSVLFKVTQSQLEPRPLIHSILQRAIELRKSSASYDPQLLQCEVIRSLPEARTELMANLEDYLAEKKETLSTDDVLLVFKILRQAKVSKSRLCNIYWKKVLDKLKSNAEEQDSDRLVHHCHRYMYFNNNLGGTYRYFPYERFVLDLILKELREGVSQLVPSKLVRLSSFLIGYGTSPTIPQLILDKIIASKDQLSFTDCLQLSRGIQIALELRFKRGLPHEFARQILQLETLIDNATGQKLKEKPNISITEANIIMRGLLMRKSTNPSSSEFFPNILNRYEQIDFPITSRIIRDTTMNLGMARIKSTKLLEAFLSYLVASNEIITGDVTEKIIHTCFTLGHETENKEALRLAGEIVERDFESMTGLAIVNCCLSLCSYGALSHQLMTKMFCIDFIKRLEDEIKMCYSKATYPQKVLNKVMQLNRSVCLDYPEYSVPWFQQNYVEAQTTKSSPNEVFQEDVRHRLKQIFRDDIDKFELNHSTAYGYRLDFLVKLDATGKLLATDTEKCVRRLAIILLGPNSFCTNDTTALCGYEQLRRRHLEILGFEVLEISYRDWTTNKCNLDTLRDKFIDRKVEIVQ